MGDIANDSPDHETLEQMASHLDSVKVKEEVRVKKEFKLNDLEGQRRSAFMTYKVSLPVMTQSRGFLLRLDSKHSIEVF